MLDLDEAIETFGRGDSLTREQRRHGWTRRYALAFQYAMDRLVASGMNHGNTMSRMMMAEYMEEWRKCCMKNYDAEALDVVLFR